MRLVGTRAVPYARTAEGADRDEAANSRRPQFCREA